MHKLQEDDKINESKNMKDKKKKIFIGVAWPYVNGDLHVGHLAGYLLPADILARYLRAVGNDVLMVSGSDCFGTPITVEADKKGVSPKEIVEIYHTKTSHLLKDVLNLSYDIYTKTDTEHHIKVVQDIFVKLLNDGYIFVDTTKQYFSPKENKFLPDRYVEGTCKNCGFTDARSDQCDNCGKVLEEEDLENPKSKLSGDKVELKDTQHYFLDWPKLQSRLEKYVEKSGPNWKNWVYQETLGWLKIGIKPRAISRDLDWGVPLPVDRIPHNLVIENIKHKRLYVWFDAVIGYLSASMLWSQETGVDWKDFWKDNKSQHYYFMGKDNLIFHTIFWPGQLMAYDSELHLPDVPSINMFLNLEGKQFSKSRGVSIPIQDIVEKYGNDPVRFYLTLIMPELKDSSFSWKEFYEKNNEILVGNFGNFIHRVLSLAYGINVKNLDKYDLAKQTLKEIGNTFEKSRKYLEKCEFRNYLECLLKLSSFGNKYINDVELWTLKTKDPKRFEEVLKQLYYIILSLGILVMPIFPESSQKIFSTLGLQNVLEWPELGNEEKDIKPLLKKINSSIKPTPFFKKLDILTQKIQGV